MKLVFCPKCQDVVKFSRPGQAFRRCECGASGGAYAMGGHNAVLFGDGIPLGIDNTNFVNALKHQPDKGLGERFTAFVIPRECSSVRYLPRCEQAQPSPQQAAQEVFDDFPSNVVRFQRN